MVMNLCAKLHDVFGSLPQPIHVVTEAVCHALVSSIRLTVLLYAIAFVASSVVPLDTAIPWFLLETTVIRVDYPNERSNDATTIPVAQVYFELIKHYHEEDLLLVIVSYQCAR